MRKATSCLLAVIALGNVSPTRGGEAHHTLHGYTIAGAQSRQILYGGSIQTHKAPADSFYLYGGPGTTEGKFQTSSGAPDMQGWIGVDLTEREPYWRLDTFNSPTGTQAAWCGRTVEDVPEWVTAPGYGNNWNEHLVLTVRVDKPIYPTDLTWTFTYNHDLEPIYDFFAAMWDSAGYGPYHTIPLLLHDGTNKDSLGVFTPVTQQLTRHIEPSQYTGEGSDEITLRFRVTSDGGWSDEDGLWPTMGAVQLDDVVVDLGPQGGPYVENFESGFELWQPEPTDFAGDFAKVFGDIKEIDPCRDNPSPQLNFIDDNTPPSNGNGRTTGGSVPPCGFGQHCYFVVNYDGGLSNGVKGLDNRAWSPLIDYDLPGPADDEADGVLVLAFDRNAHMPLGNGMFYVWHVRSTEDPNGEEDWTDWQDNGMIYYQSSPAALRRTRINVADKIPDLSRVQKIQIALGVQDLADVFAFPGNSATQAPTFDNVSLQKTAARGPVIQARTIDLLQGGFPQGGASASEYDGPGGPYDETAFATRIDRVGSTNVLGQIPVAGDSLTVSTRAAIPGTVLAEPPVLKYRLFANPAFDHVRDTSMHASQAGTIASGPGGPWNVWDGTVAGDNARTNAGEVLAEIFAFDPPFDGPTPRGGGLMGDAPEPAGFFPGDWFFYYIEAADDSGNTVTIPPGPGQGLVPSGWPELVGKSAIANYTGLARTNYDSHWRIRALPTVGSGARVLFVNDAFGTGNEAEWQTAFLENGMLEGIDIDSYRVFAPNTRTADNGIGSTGVHGASASQLASYDVLLYDGGSLSRILLSDGTNATFSVDRSDDQGVLTAWHNQPQDRAAIYWGDFLASFLNTNGVAYLQQILAVELGPGTSNLPGRLESHSPSVISIQSGLSFDVLGGCPEINQIDDISPLTGSSAFTTHLFEDVGGIVPGASASVTFDRVVDGFRKIDVTFPFAFQIIGPFSNGGSADGRAARSVLLEEVLSQVGVSTPGPTSTPDRTLPLRLEANWPNPFNPRTVIRFSLPREQQARLRVVDARGRVLRTLVDDVLPAGDHDIVFDGRDDRGSELASGAYLYELVVERTQLVRKLALLR